MSKSDWIFDGYAYLFARKKFYRMNKALFSLSIRGLGILNYKDEVASGEDHFVRQTLSGVSNPVVFDVGANAGDYSATVLSINPNARLFAFEPHPGTFKGLSERLAGRGAQLANVACGSAPSKMVLYDYAGAGSQHASLYKGVIEELHQKESCAYDIDIIDLDTFASGNGIEHIDLLKIDTEGHEFNVLSGAKRLFEYRRISAIQFEFNEMNLVSRTFLRDFYAILPNYRLYRTVRDGLIPLPERPSFTCELFAFQNIVALLRSPSS